MMYWTRGLTISALIFVFGSVNPNMVNIILKNSPKCCNLLETLLSSIMILNFSTPCDAMNYLSSW